MWKGGLPGASWWKPATSKKCANSLALERGLRPDRILLDNMSPEAIREAVALIRPLDPPIEIEATGGIGLHNVRDIALTGVDLVSIGALTHSAPALDLSLLFERA